MKKNKKKKNKKICWLLKVFDFKMIFYDFVKWTGALSIIVYLRLKVIYASKEAKKIRRKEAIICANHNSFMDPLILNNLTLFRRTLSVTSDALFKNNKFKTLLFKWFRCIPVDKENVSVSTFKKVAREIRYGHNVAVFPEGTVIRQDDVSKFKSGVIMMALFADAHVIPVYIKRRTSIWRRQVVVVGERIDVKKYLSSSVPTMQEIDHASEELRKEELKLKEIADAIK